MKIVQCCGPAGADAVVTGAEMGTHRGEVKGWSHAPRNDGERRAAALPKNSKRGMCAAIRAT